MKKILYLILLWAHSATAWHIVGGEIEFITLQAGRYKINVIQYFDAAQTENPGPEGMITVFIYRNADDEFMSSHDLPFIIQQEVAYTNEECAIDQLKTDRIVWSAEVLLDPQEYDDPEGYYVVWERCCRNERVVNIVSPEAQGMTYVTDIPPLWRNGQPFINSTPELFRPLSDYACQDQLYYIEFTGRDRDGDSLVYKLAEPLNSHFGPPIAITNPQPKPYSPLMFNTADGYSFSSMIIGNPGLAISNRGLLTVNPSRPGLHVFSVIVEEYRKGSKIGQVQRDFQMLVLPAEQCNPPDPPQVGVQIPNRLFFREEVDTLKYKTNEDKCFLFVVKNLSEGEEVNLRAEGVNFVGDLDEIFAINTYTVNERTDSLVVQVCAPECPPLGNDPFILDLIAADNACPLPQLDTVRLVFQIEPIPNSLPEMSLENANIVLAEGNTYETSFTVTDADMDDLTVELQLPGYDDPGLFGFSIQTVKSEPGLYEGLFQWDTDCQEYDFDVQQRFNLLVRAEDKDFCDYENPEVVVLDMNVILPANNNPVTAINNAPPDELISDIDQMIEFEVEAIDPDGDIVTLEMFGDGFNPAAYGVTFDPITSLGTAKSTFRWFADCRFAIPGADNSYTFLFVGRDADLCNLLKADTLSYTIHLNIPDNNAPVINPIPYYELEVNEPFELTIDAFDLDPEDQLTLSFFNGVRLPNSPSIAFEPVTGQSYVSGTFRWTPECSLLKNGLRTRYDVVFQVRDDFCPTVGSDTLKVTFFIEETRANFDAFLPPNAFSPNGDQINDTFKLSGYDDDALNLPVDNCEDYFQYVTVHDRTGRPIYHTEDRDFEWDGGDHPAGVYFYSIKYALTEYKNYIQLIR